jgi:hypothetical protein
MHSASTGKVHRIFASLRMTKILFRGWSAANSSWIREFRRGDRDPSTPQLLSLRESNCYAQDDRW